MPFLSDDFTGESGVTTLSAHTPTGGGGTYAARQTISGGSANAMRIQPNAGDPYVETISSAIGWWTNGAVPPTADYDVTVVLNRSGFSGNHNGVIGRFASEGTFYQLEINEYASPSQLRLVRYNAWAQTVLPGGTYNYSPGDGNHTLKLEMIGAVIKGYLNGVERINVTDSSPLTAAGLAGLCLSGARAKSISANNLGTTPKAAMHYYRMAAALSH